MTAHQEAYNMISKMPDESVKILLGLLRNMAPAFLTGAPKEGSAAQRIGAGKGVIVDSPNFDALDGEVTALFEGGTL